MPFRAGLKHPPHTTGESKLSPSPPADSITLGLRGIVELILLQRLAWNPPGRFGGCVEGEGATPHLSSPPGQAGIIFRRERNSRSLDVVSGIDNATDPAHASNSTEWAGVRCGF